MAIFHIVIHICVIPIHTLIYRYSQFYFCQSHSSNNYQAQTETSYYLILQQYVVIHFQQSQQLFLFTLAQSFTITIMSFRFYSRIFIRGTALITTSSVGSLAVADYAGSDSGIVRSYNFWRKAVPIYTHYRYIEWKTKDEMDPVNISKAYRPLHDKYSPTVQKLVLDLKGFYYKLAQIMSTRDDFLAEQYLEWTKQLQDQCPSTLPSNEIRNIVEQSLKIKIDDVFSEWQDQPIGAASIGQVHHAILKETGKPVAIKIQYPGIERKFRNDIETVELFCKYLMPQNSSFFEEIKKQFLTEFDARGEADNLKLVHDNLHKSGWNQAVEVPVPIFSSKEVLVMSYLPGPKFVDGVREQYQKLAAEQGIDFAEMEAEQKRLIESGQIEKKDVLVAAAESRRIKQLLRLGDILTNTLILIGNYTIRPFIRSEKWEYKQSQIPLNLGDILHTLLKVHAHEIFFDGAFNGDPHPGNILLMPDGRLGLIDYGQVKRMALKDRITYAKLILAINRDDRKEIVRLMTEEIGLKTKYMNEDIIYKHAVFYNCRDSDDVLEGRNISEFMEYIEKADPVEKINNEFVMVGRVSILMRGMANAFGMQLKVSEYWKDCAQDFLKSQGIDY